MNSPSNTAPNTDRLVAGGFKRTGVWKWDEASGSIRFEGNEPVPREPGVYAYAVGGVVHYVGSAQRGLRKRLRHYEVAKTLRTAHRIRQEILTLIAAGREVEVFTIVPPTIPMTGGLPFDSIAGLEEGLIRAWRPIWNRRGMGAGT
jgi:hypothetical protein